MNELKKPKQLNFNTVLLLLIGTLISFCVKKLDETNTQLIQVSMSSRVLADQVNDMRGQMRDLVLKSDFERQIKRIDETIERIEQRFTTSRSFARPSFRGKDE